MNEEILAAYRSDPMHNGDVLLFVEELRLATEVEGLADNWDSTICRNLSRVLLDIGAREVVLAVARPHAVPDGRDHQLVRDLRDELGSSVVVPDLLTLPAADAA